jgi:hypothetical protein
MHVFRRPKLFARSGKQKSFVSLKGTEARKSSALKEFLLKILCFCQYKHFQLFVCVVLRPFVELRGGDLYKIYRRPTKKFTPELNWKILVAGKRST